MKFSKRDFKSILEKFSDVNEYISNIVRLKEEISENNFLIMKMKNDFKFKQEINKMNNKHISHYNPSKQKIYEKKFLE